MNDKLPANVIEAEAILNREHPAAAEEIAGLEKTLARDGQRGLARRLRSRRIELDESRANEILSGGSSTPREMLKLAKRLATDKRFGLARRILIRARKDLKKSGYPDIYLRIFQKSSLYTYKDPDLPVEWRLDRALEILQEVEDLAKTEDVETLGLTGAIFKRKWEVDNMRQNLERSLFYYLKGYAQGAPEGARANVLEYLRNNPACTLQAKDQGWNGINAAFVLDLLAQQEQEEADRAGLQSETAHQRHQSARLIREEITRSVPLLLEKKENQWLSDEWWFYATVGEAYFGLGKYDAASYEKSLEWLIDKPAAAGLAPHIGAETAAALEIPEWEYESTARQLTRLAMLQAPSEISEEEFAKTGAGDVLRRFLCDDHRAVGSAFRGKFGLALSGGGFRASLFHIGVLARLAELDVLRNVEVISCVSGGSIIGAHYYLELRRLFESKTDDKIEPGDYVNIVERIEQKFLEGVQRNIRTRVLAEWSTNLKMIFTPGYSRTMRVGELYERELYREVPDAEFEGPRWQPDWLARLRGWNRNKRWLNRLFIQPIQADGSKEEAFNPRWHNWRRENKVPILILNATTLNTGHNWQFTASFMGEPPTPINEEIDANDRYRRMYYRDAPPRHRQIRLGHAVAASSCVPGLFEPLILDGLYPGRSVRLVDGGVCDNQGVASLLEQDCSVLLVSDASGQMETQTLPSRGVLGVPLRSNSILQARVREAQYSDVTARRKSSLLRGLMFVHLKEGIPADHVAWDLCPSRLKESEFEQKLNAGNDATCYNVAVDVQRKLAAIRTDLDSFNDAEAFALMVSAYRMTAMKFEGDNPCVDGFLAPKAKGNWRFLDVDSAMKPRSANDASEPARDHLMCLLDAGANAAFKVWRLSPALVFLKWALVFLACAAVVALFYRYRDSGLISAKLNDYLTVRAVGYGLLTMAAMTLLGALINALVGRKHGRRIMRAIRWRDTLGRVLTGIGMATAGFLVARLHLHVFDKIYLRCGKLERFPK